MCIQSASGNAQITGHVFLFLELIILCLINSYLDFKLRASCWSWFFVLAKIHATYIVYVCILRYKCYMLVQGRLAPLETHVKQDRRGIGAENNKKKRVIASLKDSQDQHGLSKVDQVTANSVLTFLSWECFRGIILAWSYRVHIWSQPSFCVRSGTICLVCCIFLRL